MTAAPDIAPGGIAWDEELALTAADGARLRACIWRARGEGRGLVLYLNGRTEFLEKCAPAAAELTNRGFTVASLDWRGQGLSQRLLASPLKGHVGQFADYHLDLQALMAAPEIAAVLGPRVVLAHSMGGAIGLGAIARGLLDPEAVILTAPMLGIDFTLSRRVATRAILPIARTLGLLERWPPFAPKHSYVLDCVQRDKIAGNVLTGDRALFAWMGHALDAQPMLQLASPTMGWIDTTLAETGFLARQGPLPCPALCLLGTSEAVVSAQAIREAAPRLGAELVEIPSGQHELLIEMPELRAQAWAAIDQLLARAEV